jgi:asparagine synthase (glutamine-hydrolysing)
MAHGLEARVPFLDQEVIEHALALPASAKAVGPGAMEKQLLREAFRGWLPDEILWRRKEQFGDGSGAADALADGFSNGITAVELERERHVVTPPLRSTEELAYYRIYARRLPGLRPERTLTRFAEA